MLPESSPIGWRNSINYKGVTNSKIYKGKSSILNMEIKGIGQLEGEIIRSLSLGPFPVMVMDTGGMIDFVNSMRQYTSSHRNGKNVRYAAPTTFFKALSAEVPIVITPKTYQEIQNHGRTRLNGHAIELAPDAVNFALDTMIESAKLISRVKILYHTMMYVMTLTGPLSMGAMEIRKNF